MKKKLFILLLLLPSINIMAQMGGKVIYKVRRNPNYISDNIAFNMLPQTTKDSILKLPVKTKQAVLKKLQSKTDKALQGMEAFDKKIFAVGADFEYILKFNSTSGLYAIDPPMRVESIDPHIFLLAKLNGGGDFWLYQKKGDSVYYHTNPQKKPLIWTKIPYIKWTITNTKGKIGKYRVIKATSSRRTAWFTPDIPVPFGPSSAGGLPGLVLKFDAGIREIYASKIILSKDPVKINMPKGEIISQEEWQRRKQMAKAKKANSGFITRKK